MRIEWEKVSGANLQCVRLSFWNCPAFFKILQVGPGDEVGSGGIDCVWQLGFEPDSSDLGLWLRHEFLNRLEDDPKLGFVFLLQLNEASGKPLVQ